MATATKKASPAKSSTGKKKVGMMKSKTVQSAKKTASKVIKKTKEVLGDMLAGAAIGAVKGAAEAVAPKEGEKKPTGKKAK